MKNKKIPMRQCIGCRQSKEKNQLIRIVKVTETGTDSTDESAELQICIDRTGKRNGRGAYICDDPDCLKRVRKTRGLNRAFKVEVSDEIYEKLERQLSE